MSINKYDSTTGDLIPIHSGEVMYADSPIGTILSYGGSTAPNGFLLCNGAAVSRTTYSDLFAVIGTSYGAGDGSTTFNVPNLQGKVAVGYSGGETEFNTIGKTGGEKAHTLTVTEMPAHNHQTGEAYKWTGSGVYSAPAGGGVVAYGEVGSYNKGGGGAHNNIQPYVVTNYIIKAKQTPMPADMQGEVDDINGEITQIKSDLGDSWQLQPNARHVTLATANGVKTVNQLMSDALTTLRSLTIPSGYGWKLMDIRIPVSTTGRQQMIIMPEGMRTAFSSTTNIQGYAVTAGSIGVATYAVSLTSNFCYCHQMYNTTYTDLGTIVPNNGLTIDLWYELYKHIN